MNLTLKVWRQKDVQSQGRLVTYQATNVLSDMSFLEMLDVVNEDLMARGEDPIAFDSDCREGICGTCSMVINGKAHGGQPGTTVCQLHMRHFQDGQTILIEPWRARPFPVLKDLITDRSAFDRIIQAGGFVSVNTGGAPDGNALPIAKTAAEQASTKSLALFYLSAWKNSASAQAFAQLYADELGRKYSGLKLDTAAKSSTPAGVEEEIYSTDEGPVLITTRGKLVFVAESFDLELALKLSALILDAQGTGELRMTGVQPGAPGLNRRDGESREPLTAGLIRFFSDCGVMKAAVNAAVQAAR